jgi:hypothetical protein
MATRLTRHLVWSGAAEGPRQERALAATKISDLLPLRIREPEPPPETPSLDVYQPARERAVYLLTVGAEVEHALMVQYLFAGYSMGGSHLVDPVHIELVREWRATILEIAREEMGHLATVENLLTLIGGPLSFARENYPAPTDLYPFPFELEPLTKYSLGKYVLAEMPSEETVAKLGLKDEIESIKNFVGARDDLTVHRVGLIYSAIQDLFTAPAGFAEGPKPETRQFIAAADIQGDSEKFQVKAGEWGLGYKDILICSANNRTSALNAIQKISTQGEGSDIGDLEASHFGKFLNIYRKFPAEGGWAPSRKVAKNPTTDPLNDAGSLIEDKRAYRWARLSDLRYRMLLMLLAHSFAVDAPAGQSVRTVRGLLITWAFGEMYNLRSIAEILMQLPLKAGSDLLAGPPFEVPYSLALPQRAVDRWRLHRDMLLSSQYYVGDLLDSGGEEQHRTYLEGLRSTDAAALQQITSLIGA